MKVIRLISPFNEERKRNIKELQHLINKYISIDKKKETIEKIKLEQ